MTVSVYFCILVEGGILSFRYWLMYLGASLLIYVVAALLNHWRMCKDPDNKTVSGSLVFILTIILGILAFPATLLLMGLVEHLLMKRFSGKDEESYRHGYFNGYDDGSKHMPYDSSMK